MSHLEDHIDEVHRIADCAEPLQVD